MSAHVPPPAATSGPSGATSGPSGAPSGPPSLPALRERLAACGIGPSAQRLAIAEVVLATDRHPCAEAVLAAVSARLPSISRATVYATLALFVERGLLRELALEEGRVVYDPKLEPHHHFIDDATGAIVDVPWDALAVRGVPALPGVDVREYQVVLRGSLHAGDRRSSPPTPHPQA
jgi:Fur family iron response transcriptional regulator